MKLDLITLSVPLFFAGILIELAFNGLLARKYYVLGDALGSIGTGVLDQLAISLTRAALFTAPYIWLYEHVAPRHFEQATLLTLAGGLLLADFGYYWGHRFSHEVAVLWAGHVVHHSSEEYNLSTALRQNWFSSWFLYLFNMPLAAFGIAPPVAMLIIPFIQLYQFWIHTRMIPKLGSLELVFNTPSHHRVHHGMNPEYCDRNYGAILIVWDRLFGTFAEEKGPVMFGALKPLASWNPVTAWIAPWRELLAAKSWRCWLKPPGWDVDTGKGPDLAALFADASRSRFNPPLSRKVALRALAAFLVVLLLAATYLFEVPRLRASQALLISLALAGAMWAYGAWMDRRAAVAR